MTTHDQKEAARRAVAVAVASGELTRPTACERCGTTDKTAEGHHHDYSKPLDVEWLCRDCHAVAHREARAASVDGSCALLSLRDVRAWRKLSQAEVAQRLGVSQARVSKIESSDNLAVSTLNDYAAALDGTVQLEAVFPDGERYVISP